MIVVQLSLIAPSKHGQESFVLSSIIYVFSNLKSTKEQCQCQPTNLLENHKNQL